MVLFQLSDVGFIICETIHYTFISVPVAQCRALR